VVAELFVVDGIFIDRMLQFHIYLLSIKIISVCVKLRTLTISKGFSCHAHVTVL